MAGYLNSFLNLVKVNVQTFWETLSDKRVVLPHYLCNHSAGNLVEPLRSFRYLYEELWGQGQAGLDFLRSVHGINEDPEKKLGLANAKTIKYDVYDLNKVRFSRDFIHPSRFLVRKEYVDIHEHIEMNGKDHHIVTGNPGIGKSWFLMYELIHRLADGKTTIYAPNAEYWFLFHRSGVYAFDATHMNKLDELLKDWYPYEAAPDLMHTSGDILFDCNSFQPILPFDSKGWRKSWRCIITASPRHVDFKRFQKEWPSTHLCAMMSWSWYEIVAINALLPLMPKPIDKLWELYSKYGPTPRIAYNTTEATIEKNVEKAVLGCASSEILFSPLNIDSCSVTRTLLAVEPQVLASKVCRDTLVLRISTPYIADYLIRAALKRNDLTDSFRQAVPSMLKRKNVLGAMLFKAAARYCLQNDDAAKVLRPLSSKKAYKLVLGIETVHLFPSVNDLKIHKEGTYFVPAQPMFPAIDALAFVMKTPILIRYTTSKKCPIDTAGLELLGEVLPKTKWSYVFIVPDSIVDDFQPQPLTRPLKKDRSIQIEQYVMGLSIDDLFPRAQKAIDMNLQQSASSMTSRESMTKRRLDRSDSALDSVPVAKRLRSNESNSSDGSGTISRPRSGKKVTVEIPKPRTRIATRRTRGVRS